VIITFRGLVHIIEDDFPRLYSFSWREKPNYSIALEISRDAVEIVEAGLKRAPMLEGMFEEFRFKKFGSDINAERYGFDDCAIASRLGDGSIELIFNLIKIKDKESQQHLYACAATIHVILNVLDAVPEKEINEPIPQFVHIGTACCKHKMWGHGGTISGELNKDVKRYLIWHYKTKGTVLKKVLSALLKAARILRGRKVKPEPNMYWAEVRSETGFLSIDCPGNACGLNSKDADEYYSLIREKKEEDFGMDLICHNVDTIGQQMVLLAAIAALSDEVRKYYLASRSG
jgi:hypothetical protein